MKSLLKHLIRKTFGRAPFEYSKNLKMENCYSSYMKAIQNQSGKKIVPNEGYKSIIIPTDAWSLIGARGDDAMISAAVGEITRAYPEAEIYIVTASETADEAAKLKSLVPVRIWQKRNYFHEFKNLLDRINPQSAIILGGDVLDGYYDEIGAAKLIASAGISNRNSIPVTFLGFSFNSTPAKRLKPFWDSLGEKVNINLRDKVSLERFKLFTEASPSLVADSAFVLNPNKDSEYYQSFSDWCERQRRLGKKVIGINYHPMLFGDNVVNYQEVAELFGRSIHKIGKNYSWALIPHDYRGVKGDDVCLLPLRNYLNRSIPEEVFYIEGQHDASTLKAISSCCDGIIAGRMHLAIAALGSGTPVLALTYQDKFEGLYDHFEFSKDLLLTPELMLDGECLDHAIVNFLGKLNRLKLDLEKRLPNVKNLSKINFKIIRNSTLEG